MSLEIIGSIKEFLAVESGIAKTSGNEWQKQNFIVSNNDGYEGKEQLFCFEVFGAENVENLAKYNKVGDNVKVSFNIGTNEWQGKYFTSLKSWRVEKIQDEGVQEHPTETHTATVVNDSEPDDPLPF